MVLQEVFEFFQVYGLALLLIIIAIMVLYHFEVIQKVGVCGDLFPSNIEGKFVKNSWMKKGFFEPGFFECCRYYYYEHRQTTQCRIFEEVVD